MIHNIKIVIDQCDSNAYDDSGIISVEMNDDDAEKNGRRVYIRQTEDFDVDPKNHEIFIDGKKSLENLISVLQFIRDQKGWSYEERIL